MFGKFILVMALIGSVAMVGCGGCKKAGEPACNKKMVFEDGTPAPCCKTVTKFSH